MAAYDFTMSNMPWAVMESPANLPARVRARKILPPAAPGH